MRKGSKGEERYLTGWKPEQHRTVRELKPFNMAAATSGRLRIHGLRGEGL